jgi:hypothetical protein
MPPQPLSKVRADASFALGPGALPARPQLAALVAEVIAFWSEVELQRGRLLGSLLGSSYEIAVAMYLALTSATAQRAALDAAARVALSDPEYELFRQMAALAKPAEAERNHFAHGLWGVFSGRAGRPAVAGFSLPARRRDQNRQSLRAHAKRPRGTTRRRDRVGSQPHSRLPGTGFPPLTRPARARASPHAHVCGTPFGSPKRRTRSTTASAIERASPSEIVEPACRGWGKAAITSAITARSSSIESTKIASESASLIRDTPLPRNSNLI